MSPAAPAGVARTWTFHEVLLHWGPAYLERYGLAMPARQRQVLRKILACRTSQRGGELYACERCGHFHYVYHSCNDRHCPLCGQTDAQDWLEQHSQLILPVPYFMVGFTLPEPLRRWVRSHPKLGYRLLFQSSADALQDLAANPRRLGARLGMLAILHTWSRTLIYHPHIHYLLPGGGLSLDQRQWVSKGRGFFLSKNPLADRYRNLFKATLAKEAPQALAQLPVRIWKQRWVVEITAVGSGHQALAYLSRYVFKTATANRSTKQLADGKLRWPYRNSRTRRWTHIDLEPEELIRRFLQHILPPYLHRVRLLGWLHPARRTQLNRVRALLRQRPLLTPAQETAWQLPEELSPPHESELTDPTPSTPYCPKCPQPMSLVARWQPGQPLPSAPPRGPP